MRAFLYFAGLTGVGGLLYFFATPSANSEYQRKIQKDQGTLSKEMQDSHKNTNLLMAKLRSEAGIKADEDKSK
ncbi:hypothetical protein PoB_003390500 [Plakobranchus ocellatus]|uniref:Ubiquinol-cytochrome-c reductase complex assembly factor 3 n=1 Tax=Plakobranchus ocellatus TaxID=259542 RepID=A0AAV4AJ91_9GAST|nr:hypothetical protein PoB_003390500 [Plakobranchus ocellatus]